MTICFTTRKPELFHSDKNHFKFLLQRRLKIDLMKLIGLRLGFGRAKRLGVVITGLHFSVCRMHAINVGTVALDSVCPCTIAGEGETSSKKERHFAKPADWLPV